MFSGTQNTPRYDPTPAEIDIISVKAVVGNTNQVMVYGWRHAKYQDVYRLLSNANSPIEKVFDCEVGGRELDIQARADRTTLEGREIEQLIRRNYGYENCILDPYAQNALNQTCKNGIANLVLENYKRLKENKEIIPLIFCACSDSVKQEPEYISTAQSVATRNRLRNEDLSSNHELRRIYRIYKEFGEDRDKLLARAATETFKFVEVTGCKERRLVLNPYTPVWELEGIDQAMATRASTKKPREIMAQDDYDWRTDLRTRVRAYAKPPLWRRLLNLSKSLVNRPGSNL